MSRFQIGRPAVQPNDEPIATKTAETALRSRLERQKVTLRLPRQIVRKAKVFCAVNRIDLQDAVSEGLELFMENLTSFVGRPAVQPSTINDFDDQKNDDEEVSNSFSSSLLPDSGRLAVQTDAERLKDSLLQLYSTETGNAVNDRDQRSYLRVAHLGEKAIRQGILKSALLCKRKINSFEYCVGAIEEMAEADLGADYTEYLASKLRIQGARANRARQTNLPGAGAEVLPLEKKGPRGN